MKLYYTPGACSFAGHVVLHEAETHFESESVDLRTKRTASGGDFNAVTAKGYVPALVLGDGQTLTENIAVLDYLASRFPQFAVDGPLGRSRLLEALAFISTELHKGFKTFWHHGTEASKAEAGAAISKRLRYLADEMSGDYLFGGRPTVADFYLLVVLLWAEKFGVGVPAPLLALKARLLDRPAVQSTLKSEGSALAASAA